MVKLWVIETRDWGSPCGVVRQKCWIPTLVAVMESAMFVGPALSQQEFSIIQSFNCNRKYLQLWRAEEFDPPQ